MTGNTDAEADGESAVHPGTLTRRTYLAAGIIFIIALLYLAHSMGSRPFWTRGEAREAIVVQAMFDQSNYVLPLRNGIDIPSKPPMFHWLASLAAHSSGHLDEFSVRSPSAFMAAFMLLSTFLFAFLASGYRLAFLSSLILATSFEFLRGASHARVDMTFSAFLVAGLFLAYRAYENLCAGTSVRTWHSALFVACLTAAILSKGPAAVVVLSLVFGLYHVLRVGLRPSELAKTFPIKWFLLTTLLAIAAAGIWYLLAYFQQGSAFMQVQLWKENVSRVAAGSGGHQKSILLLPLLSLAVFLPWALLLPYALIPFRVRSRIENNKPSEHTGILYFSLSVVAVFILLVSLSGSRRVVYFLPCVPFLALILSYGFIRADKEPLEYPYTIRFGYLMLTISSLVLWILVLSLAATVQSPDIVDRLVLFISDSFFNDAWANKVFGGIEAVRNQGAVVYSGFAVVGLLAAAAFLLKRKRAVFAACLFALSILSVHFIAVGYVLPQIVASRDPRPFMTVVQRYVQANSLPVYELHSTWYTTRFYFDRDIPLVPSLERLQGTERAYYIVSEEDSAAVLWRYPNSFVRLTTSENNAGNGRKKLVLLEQIADLTETATTASVEAQGLESEQNHTQNKIQTEGPPTGEGSVEVKDLRRSDGLSFGQLVPHGQ